ncbi:MAG: hypothetical protein LQ342_008438 [Letrouitia transgressa]|nr:MAG: hypothetical protein LQ342_008438 [Letrouitia transgressa]
MTDDESSMAIGKYLRQETRTLVKSRIDVEKFAIGAVERNHEFLDLKVPYILYQRFMTTSAFKKAQDLKVEDEKKRVWDEEYEKEGKGVKESSSDSNVAVSANAQEAKLSTRISPRSETESKIKKDVGGRRLAGNFRMLRFGRTKVEAVDSGLFASQARVSIPYYSHISRLPLNKFYDQIEAD